MIIENFLMEILRPTSILQVATMLMIAKFLISVRLIKQDIADFKKYVTESQSAEFDKLNKEILKLESHFTILKSLKQKYNMMYKKYIVLATQVKMLLYDKERFNNRNSNSSSTESHKGA